MERLIIFRFPLDKSEAFCYNKVSNFGVWRSPVARDVWERVTDTKFNRERKRQKALY